ncbi:oxoglutarate dehydrogenase [Saprolegnia parasitica CBS 223.65]|uniref:2-oxoglutarate dehydrogenase, mitochondrial n=1 Tax=Saprolegnia parasitica (strain CBS 223.65) TaxID=695850 RepID=A0A067BV66_SAPPC|nr:oxoglutarate dehydrogenase [Saprolegnia parasitica CBS 223.65]KDO20700.1 oxoglutarate dehydrogenase [Saprolegnia parasitica CBS 223.65]|eukprot:XP_012208602.1 oxoglutarate dehydrogenase [Saprolegnia parasitica CBS 223.65]
MAQWSKLAAASRVLRRSTTMKAPLLRAFSSAPHPSESFINGTNNVYVEEMYRSWTTDPSSVHKSWDVYFRQVDQGAVPGEAFIPPPTSRGHEMANLDPLGLQERPVLPELDIKMYGFTDADLDKTIDIPKNFASGVTGFLEELTEGQNPTLGQIVQRLKETYCSSIGVQYMHIPDREKCNWIRTHVEHLVKKEESKEKKMHILERLAFSVNFEKFLGNKYNTTKRFGLDGGESLIPGLKYMIDRATEMGMEHVVVGMPHRGRLNVLANVIRKPIQQIFKEFQGTHFDLDKYVNDVDDWSNSGDVKYHLGTSFDRTYPDGRKVHLSLVANPSHLEAVNPVVEGKVRAKQYYLGNDDDAEKKVMPLLLHGDAAFSGQGVVYETMHLSELENYDTGGTVHVVVNNQIGFTTDPKNSRSSQYCSDVGKAMNVPIFHVNGDDPVAVVKVFELAAEWRQTWRSDVIINLTCYRKFGHNEIDNPFFTQPLMYKKIGSMPNVLDTYAQQLVASGVATMAETDAVISKVWDFFGRTFEESKNWEDSKKSDWLANRWESFKSPTQQSRIRPTGVEIDTLKKIGDKLTTVPDGFELNSQLKRIISTKRASIETGEGLDWSSGEALAWGSLLLEGNHVRISGQDVERGTFSHRHAVLHDQKTNNEHVPLNTLAPTLTRRRRCNSSLSEFGVLGFELGYSLENPNALVMWEAQFGDFANGAQIIIDQFLSAGEDKWMRQSGLVMLLPHGYEGQGAEHSSCRIERFLQQTDDDPNVVPPMDEDHRMQIQQTNWQIVYCSTPAQYFHVLRRQLHREFRKPLISVQPKSLLRLKQASSSLAEMGPGTKFHRVLGDDASLVANDKVKRVLFCSGKIYYDLAAEREANKIDDIAIVRVEQIAPFPFDKVAEYSAKYPNAEVKWVQEEPENMGFWTYVSPRFETALKTINQDTRRPSYIGRVASAAPPRALGLQTK